MEIGIHGHLVQFQVIMLLDGIEFMICYQAKVSIKPESNGFGVQVHADVDQYTAEQYWVGDNYTDWLGIDGYNWGSSQSWSKWQWPNEVFDNMVGRLRKLSSTKPLSFNEFGTVGVRIDNTTDVQSKNE